MKNTVIKGDYKNWYLSIHKELEGINDNIEISNNTIIDYDIKYTEFKRDIIDIVIRIIIGVLLIGPIGILAGFTANKSFISYRLISIEFKNGNKSLVKIDNRTFIVFSRKSILKINMKIINLSILNIREVL